MSDDPEAAHERAAIQQMTRRLDGFAPGLGNKPVRSKTANIVTSAVKHSNEPVLPTRGTSR